MSVGENGTLVGKNPPLQSKSTITILYRTIDNKIRRVTRCLSNLHSTLYFVIKKQVEIQSNKDQEELMLYISAKRKGADKPTKGQCKRTDEGFVILAGSMIETNYTESTPNSVRLLKEKYIENNEIIDGILQEDKLFSSPSYAASFVLGRSINGKELWKTKEGLSLNDLETKEME